MTVTKFLLPKKTQITLIQLAFTYSKQTMETPEKSPKSEKHQNTFISSMEKSVFRPFANFKDSRTDI